MKLFALFLICIVLLVVAPFMLALKCRTDDGPSDEDMKRVARSCMRKVGENGGRYYTNQSDSSNVGYNDRDYDDYSRDDRYRQDKRDHLQIRNRRVRSSNDRRYDSSSSGSRNQNQNQRSGGGSHYGGGGGQSNNNNSSSHVDRQSHDHDGACVVHCFFEELNMLNNDDYPDKHRVNYILTKDIRDRELRMFYVDTIQECFHYLEMQRRKDKCVFAKELINCMMEYARANCEDWQDHTLIFS